MVLLLPPLHSRHMRNRRLQVDKLRWLDHVGSPTYRFRSVIDGRSESNIILKKDFLFASHIVLREEEDLYFNFIQLCVVSLRRSIKNIVSV